MSEKGAAAMALAHEELEEKKLAPQRQSPRRDREPAEPQNVAMTHKDKAHITNEMLLAAGGTVAGAAFLGVTFGGALGAVAAAAAGLGVAIYNVKTKLKEGARRS